MIGEHFEIIDVHRKHIIGRGKCVKLFPANKELSEWEMMEFFGLYPEDKSYQALKISRTDRYAIEKSLGCYLIVPDHPNILLHGLYA